MAIFPNVKAAPEYLDNGAIAPGLGGADIQDVAKRQLIDSRRRVTNNDEYTGCPRFRTSAPVAAPAAAARGTLPAVGSARVRPGRTVADFERECRAVSEGAIAAIRAALGATRVEFTNGSRPGVKNKGGLHGRVHAQKKRVRKRKTPSQRETGSTKIGLPHG